MPVMMVNKEIKAHAPARLEVMVDAVTAAENITRFANNAGYTVEKEERGRDFLLRLSKEQ